MPGIINSDYVLSILVIAFICGCIYYYINFIKPRLKNKKPIKESVLEEKKSSS